MAADLQQRRSTALPAPDVAAHGCSSPDVGAAIARTLHDDVAQDLFLAHATMFELAQRLPVGSAERTLADTADERVRSALRGTRALVEGLRSADEPAGDDLAPVICRELVDFSARTGIAVSYSESGSPQGLPPQAVAHVLAVVREALVNVRKHADASEVRLHARHRDGWTRLTVTDNGGGFRLAPLSATETGLGIGMCAMHERARAIGGRIGLQSRAGAGTRLTLDIPPQGTLADAG